MSEHFDAWFERLLADLKSESATIWDAGKIEDITRRHLDGIDPALRRTYCELTISYFDRVIAQNDPYLESLRIACERFSDRH